LKLYTVTPSWEEELSPRLAALEMFSAEVRVLLVSICPAVVSALEPAVNNWRVAISRQVSLDRWASIN